MKIGLGLSVPSAKGAAICTYVRISKFLVLSFHAGAFVAHVGIVLNIPVARISDGFITVPGLNHTPVATVRTIIGQRISRNAKCENQHQNQAQRDNSFHCNTSFRYIKQPIFVVKLARLNTFGCECQFSELLCQCYTLR